MITLYSGLNGYEADGLNARRQSFIGRNIRSAKKDISIKNAIKGVKFAAPIALSFIPVGGGAASKVGSKLLNKGGKLNLIGRGVKGVSGNGKLNLIGRATKGVNKFGKTGVGSALKQFGAPIAKNAKARLLQKAGITAAENGTTVQEEMDKIVNNAPDVAAAKDNTMLYVGGGILALGIAYVAFKK
jgi:hypothetical protein